MSIGKGENKVELNKVLSNFSAQYTEKLADEKYNCCSLYKINFQIGKPTQELNRKMFSMGNKALLIYDIYKFYEILDEALESAEHEYSRKPVAYYNSKKYDGNLTLHQKDNEYHYQNEYRILIVPTNNKPVKIFLPGLKNISTIVNAKTLNNLKVEFEEHQ